MTDVSLTTSPDATTVQVDGTNYIISTAGAEDARDKTLSYTRSVAREWGREITVEVTDHTGEIYELQVSPDGTVTDAPKHQPEPAPAPAQEIGLTMEDIQARLEGQLSPKQEARPIPASETLPKPAPSYLPSEETSFLDDGQRVFIPETPWQKFMRSLGLRKGPTPEQEARKADEVAVSQSFAGPRSIAIINGKGGAGKTPATVFLAAEFARHGGSGVLAWDRNITRGTLGWRTQPGPHSATTLDLLPQVPHLLTAEARAADLGKYVHHQVEDKFDVLRSNPLLKSTSQKLTVEQLDGIHDVATKFYRLVFMDSGNDEGDELWLRMIEHSDALVIATTTQADRAEAARLLLQDLSAGGSRNQQLARNAVVIVSQASPLTGKVAQEDLERVAAGFAPLAREVVTIPYDPAIEAQWLHVDSLSPRTERAWLRAAAALARGL